jgi:hypothetical protein
MNNTLCNVNDIDSCKNCVNTPISLIPNPPDLTKANYPYCVECNDGYVWNSELLNCQKDCAENEYFIEKIFYCESCQAK